MSYRKAASLLLSLSDQITNTSLKEHYLQIAEQYISRCYRLHSNNGNPRRSPNYTLSNNDDNLDSIVQAALIHSNNDLTLASVIGLDEAKSAIRESVILPLQHPEWFTGIRKPWKGILLYGPPGCGKTFLARATAAEINCPFLGVDPALIFSKWVGESEQNIQHLFEYAYAHPPTIVFLDEIDSIASHRGQYNEIGVEKRVKTQLMTEMDGITSQDKDHVLVMAATNVPWELDQAFRRRFEKRIYIGLPNEKDRETLIQSLLISLNAHLDGEQYQELAGLTSNYTCSDIALLCREAAMLPIREINLEKTSITQNPLRPITVEDFQKSLAQIKPTVRPQELQRYEEWQKNFQD